MNGISDGYRELNAEELRAYGDSYDAAWKDATIPERQYRRVVADEIAKLRAGIEITPYRVALECVNSLPTMDNPRLLDVGASSAYYGEVLQRGGFQCDYTAIDYSQHFKATAQRIYPGVKFDVGDATQLPYSAGSFDVVLHSACIMHVRDWEKAVAEAARVSKRFVIFHRTPIDEKRGTVAYVKEAYGVPCMEWYFSPSELLEAFVRNGLDVIKTVDVFMNDGVGHRSYVCEKGLNWHPV